MLQRPVETAEEEGVKSWGTWQRCRQSNLEGLALAAGHERALRRGHQIMIPLSSPSVFSVFSVAGRSPSSASDFTPAS
jgi:hypothetical protein